MIAAIACITAACAAAPPTPAGYEITVRRAGDRVTVVEAGDGVRFDVTSPRGIGEATIARRQGAGDWPGRVTLRLHLRGLESLALEVGDVRLHLSVLSHGERRVLRTMRTADDERERPVPEGGEYCADVVIGAARFDVTVPAALLQPGGVLKVSWIDFYR